MRSSIRSEMHQDLENARAFLRSAQSNAPTSAPSLHTEDEPAVPLEAVASVPSPLPPPVAVSTPTEQTFVAPLLIKPADVPRVTKGRWLKRGIGIAMFGLVVAGLPLLRSKSNAIEQPMTLRAASNTVALPDLNKDTFRTDPLLPTPPANVVAIPATAAIEITPPPQPVSKLRDQPSVTVAAGGALAVSSQTSVDIYKNDVYLGSAPVTLELPAGTHTLEYRHDTLRKTLTHLITGNQTAKATITFDVTVQINSRPWAEVFLDGSEKKPLGQTPLSGVQVPIGGVLIFENPQFQSKRYRVTGNESGVQVVFP